MSLKNLAAILDPAAPDDRPFIVELSPEGDEQFRLSYGEGRARIAALARGLLKHGLRRGEAVAIVAANSADYLVLYMATMAAGLVSVCVNHKLPRETVAHIMKDSAVKFAAADHERSALVSELVPTIAIERIDTLLDPGPFAPVDMRPEETAMILYTSGSTGLPKGVPLSHGGYLWATGATPEQRPAIEGRKVLIAAPLFHMNGLFSAKMAMINGGTIVLMTSFTPRGYIRAIDRQRVDMITSVPTMLALVMRETEELARADLTCVTTAVTGSAPSTAEFFEQMQRLFPNAETANSWGTTESGPLGFGPHPEGKPKPPGSLGYLRKGIEVKFVGGEGGGAASGPTEGVLHIRTPALMTGYLNRDADTRKRLIDGWYDTGDVMRRDENGFVFFVGRADDMFQCGGENVYPGEVEKLLNRHPDVAQVCVVPVPDEIKYQLPVAFVVPKPGATPSAEALRRFALDNGPAYAHPRAVWFVDELPLAGTNKIDRKALTDRALQQFQREPKRV